MDEVEGAFAVCPLALRVVYLETNVWWNPVRKRLSAVLFETKEKTPRTIPAVLAKDLSFFLSATFNYGGVGIITGSDDLDRVHVSAPYV